MTQILRNVQSPQSIEFPTDEGPAPNPNIVCIYAGTAFSPSGPILRGGGNSESRDELVLVIPTGRRNWTNRPAPTLIPPRARSTYLIDSTATAALAGIGSSDRGRSRTDPLHLWTIEESWVDVERLPLRSGGESEELVLRMTATVHGLGIEINRISYQVTVKGLAFPFIDPDQLGLNQSVSGEPGHPGIDDQPIPDSNFNAGP